MKKTVFTTIVLTLISFFLLLALVLGALTFFAPLSLASLAKSVGSNNIAVYFYEIQYGKTNSMEDLKTLIYEANASGNYTASAKYSKIMVEKEGFSAFCREEDGRDRTGLKFADYVYGNYAVALYKTGADAEDIFLLNVYEDYVENNIFQFLLDEKDVRKDKEFLNKMKAEMGQFEENATLSKDMEYVNSLIR